MTGKPDEIEIFDEARALPTAARASYLDHACCGDTQLRAKIEAYLSSMEQHGPLDARPLGLAAHQTATLDHSGSQIGAYTLREQIGEGGMGIVYVAEQTAPVQRKVAIKIIKPGMDTKEVIARFEAERQALAFMEHPNIARVLDAGTTDGRPYFVMELVRGIPITEYCDQLKATPRERLELFQTVCDAVQHAHQKGIVHRDLKPSNVLVTQVSAKPVVKVIDFGLAKAISGQRLTEKTLYTGFMKLMGTPAYMSPEQAGLSGLDIDTRSDIYSLGVLLYELLTGTTPLDKTEIQKQAYDELCRQIREVDAPKPSTRFSTLKDAERSTVAELRQVEPRGLSKLLDGDLDRVVLKSIDKDRERRYGSPQDLAADIDRFLHDQPVLAVPPSTWYLVRKFLRRYKAVVLTSATIFAILILATILSTTQAIHLRRANKLVANSEGQAQNAKRQAELEKRRADKARQEAERAHKSEAKTAEERRRMLYASDMLLADQLWHSGDGTPRDMQNLLAAWIPTDGQSDLREFVWRYQWTRLHLSAEHSVLNTQAATVSPTGNLIVADQDGIREWDGRNRKFDALWETPDSNADTKITLSACGSWGACCDKSVVRVIELATGNVVREIPGASARFAESGDYLLVRDHERNEGDSVFELWNLMNGSSWKLEGASYKRQWLSDVDSISPDGKTVLIAREYFTVDVHHANQAETDRWKYESGYFAIAWSPNGKLVATGHSGGALLIRFVGGNSDDTLRVMTGKSAIRALAFSNDSQQLAVGSENGTVDFYDFSHFYDSDLQTTKEASSIQEMAVPTRTSTINAHVSQVSSIVFSQDDTHLATRGIDGTARLWRLTGQSNVLPAPTEFPIGGRVGLDLNFTSDGIEIAHVYPERLEVIRGNVHKGDRIVSIVDESNEYKMTSEMDTTDVERLLMGPIGTRVRLDVVSVDESAMRTVELRRTELKHDEFFRSLEFINDGRFIVTSHAGVFQRTLNGKVLSTEPIPDAMSAAVSPDGRLLAIDDYKELVLKDLQTAEIFARYDTRIKTFPTPVNAWGGCLAFSPDGKYVAMGTGNRFTVMNNDSELKVWEVKSGQSIRDPLYRNKVCISGVVFSPDGKTLFATDHYGAVRSWSTSNWHHQHTMQGLNQAVSLAISSDGKSIVQGGYEGIVIWDAESRAKRHVIRGEVVTNIEFAGNGNTFIATRMDGRSVFWDIVTGRQLAASRTDVAITCAKTSPNETLLALLGDTGETWLLNAVAMEEIDAHPLTLDALKKRATAQLADAHYSLAKETLRHILKVQKHTLTSGNSDIRTTKSRLIEALAGLGECVVISTQPMSQSAVLGKSATLRVGVANPAEVPCKYQWFFEDEPIEGATESTLTIPNVSISHLGPYRVQVSSDHSSLECVAKSDIAFLHNHQEVPLDFENGLRAEWFHNVRGPLVEHMELSSKFPNKPDKVSTIETFELPSTHEDYYGARIRGFIVPPKTGEYVFYLCSDDTSRLYLSTDDSSANKRLIASLSQWKPRRTWKRWRNDSSVSEPILLEHGQRYYLETHFKQDTRGDNLAVTWRMPDEPPPKDGDPPIPGKFLEHLRE